MLKRNKKIITLVLSVAVLATTLLAGCGSKASNTSSGGDKPVEIVWWNYPNYATVDNAPGKYEQQMIESFNKKHPNIKVKVEMLSFNGGPEKVSSAIASNSQPDIIYDFPGRIIDYARQGVMAPVDDMINDKMKSEVPKTILDACATDGKYYMYPFNTTPFMIAFNKTMLEKAGILNMLPLDRPDRIWTNEEYTAVLKAIKEKVPGVAPSVFYCKSNQGDQATRAFVANFNGGSVISDDLSKYLLNEEGPQKAMQWVADGVKSGLVLKGGEALTSNDAIDLFLQQKAASTIIYSTVLKNTNSSKKLGNFEEVFMPMPTPKGVNPKLEAFIGGFGIFDNKNPEKVKAAKTFVDFITNDAEWTKKNLVSTGGFSVRSSVTGLYNDAEYKYAEGMVKYTGKYYNAVPGFAEMRTYWFPELQNVTLGKTTPKEALDRFVEKANETLKKKK